MQQSKGQEQHSWAELLPSIFSNIFLYITWAITITTQEISWGIKIRWEYQTWAINPRLCCPYCHGRQGLQHPQLGSAGTVVLQDHKSLQVQRQTQQKSSRMDLNRGKREECWQGEIQGKRDSELGHSFSSALLALTCQKTGENCVQCPLSAQAWFIGP